LIPADGIRGDQEQESRATSALLSVMMAVPEFAKTILRYLDAPAGRVTTFSEVCLPGAGNGPGGPKVRPDGAIIVRRGNTEWGCFVEVKTGGNPQTVEQVGKYLDLAREQGMNAVLTVSNEMEPTPGESPLQFPAKQLKNVRLCHLSWWRVLSEAVVQHEHRGVSDPDQAWILSELITYLRDPRSGAGAFENLGSSWVAVRDGARQATLRAGADSKAVVAGWENFIRYVALDLCQELGANVEPIHPRGLDVPARRAQSEKTLVESGHLTASLKVPDAIAPVDVVVDLRAQQVTTSVEVQAPREGRAPTRVRWWLRQLRDVPTGIRVETRFKSVRDTTSCMLKDIVADERCALLPHDDRREPRAFTVALTREMLRNRGTDDRSFVAGTRKQILEFYGEVVQGLSAWTPKAPRMRATSDDDSQELAGVAGDATGLVEPETAE
jgi:hypothetical protein